MKCVEAVTKILLKGKPELPPYVRRESRVLCDNIGCFLGGTVFHDKAEDKRVRSFAMSLLLRRNMANTQDIHSSDVRKSYALYSFS